MTEPEDVAAALAAARRRERAERDEEIAQEIATTARLAGTLQEQEPDTARE